MPELKTVIHLSEGAKQMVGQTDGARKIYFCTILSDTAPTIEAEHSYDFRGQTYQIDGRQWDIVIQAMFLKGGTVHLFCALGQQYAARMLESTMWELEHMITELSQC